MVTELTQLQSAAVLRLGGISLTLGGLLTATIILAIAGALSWAATRAIRRLRKKATRSTQALYLLEKMTGYGILIAGLFMALSAAGLNLSSLAVFAGAIGIGLGLGLQGVVKEFVSGLFLIFDRMVSVGDYVELDDARGAIVEIGPRATRIRTNDNINIIVPNSSLIEGKVTNWTLKGDTRRIHVPFSVAYGANRAEVRDVVLKAARAIPFTLPETDDRKCQVWLVGFGESGLDFELLVWPTQDAVKRPAAMHAAYTWAIADALDEAGIEIPFPQTDLRIRSVFGHEGDDALEVLGRPPKGRSRKAAPEGPATRATSPGSNDAVEDLLRPLPDPVEKERSSAEDR